MQGGRWGGGTSRVELHVAMHLRDSQHGARVTKRTWTQVTSLFYKIGKFRKLRKYYLKIALGPGPPATQEGRPACACAQRSERAQEHLAAVVGVLQPGGGEGAAVAREADLLVVRGERGRVVERLERDDALLGARLGVGVGLGLGFRTS